MTHYTDPDIILMMSDAAAAAAGKNFEIVRW
jgi:hypothetical protein